MGMENKTVIVTTILVMFKRMIEGVVCWVLHLFSLSFIIDFHRLE